jgi:hypothetical protein
MREKQITSVPNGQSYFCVVISGYKRLWHSGGIVGYSSLLWLFPDKNVGVFASMTGSKDNSNSDTIKTILNKAADMLLELDPWLNDTTACSFPRPWGRTTPIQHPRDKIVPKPNWNISTQIDDYVGLYCNPAFGALKIEQRNSELVVRYGRFGKMKLYPITETVFDLRYIDKLWFVTHSDNNITPIRITFNSDLNSLSYPIDRTYTNTIFKRNCNSHVAIQVIDHNNMHCIHCMDGYLKIYLILINILVILFT